MPHFHPWHDVHYGDKVPLIVTGIIEISKGSKGKYELDKETGLLKLDRVLYSSMFYPINYGFIPQTLCGDGDPLDILVLSQIEIEPLCLVEAKVLGVMRMWDKGADDKIIAVATKDPAVSHYESVNELPPHFQLELKNFFEEYKKLERKQVVVEDFQNREMALEIILQNIEDYKKAFDR